MKKIINIFLPVIVFSLLLTGCHKGDKPITKKDISIVYTSDVHCGLDDNLGYSSVYAYKEKLKETNYVTFVDAGDYLQGDFIGAISNGEYVMEVMNQVNYDIITLGNHEFDYGMDELSKRLNEFKGDIASCNFSYIGEKEDKFGMIKPYVIKDYGYKKVGFIGITTPTTLVESDPENFIEDGVVAYDFGAPTAEEFYSLIQTNIDKCKADGADYVIMLSHLGSLDNYRPYSSIDVINHTSGALAFLDGHAHADVPWEKHKNKDNVDTLLVEVGYKLNEFASLTISTNGDVSYKFITEYSEKSEKIDSFIDEIKAKGDKEGDKVVANIDIDLSITDEDGIRMIRNREMPIGNMVADAYKEITSSDISFINGGGIRENLNKGDVTYKDIKNVHPFGNELMKKKTKGSKILDYLEFVYRYTDKERVKDGKPYGENGEFAHLSGLKCSIDTSIQTSVITDASGAFIKVDGPRRVKDVQVLENGTYVPIDSDKEYVISSINFILKNGGGGANMFMDDEIIPDKILFDYEVLIKYISETLKGHLKDKYSSTEGRINVL